MKETDQSSDEALSFFEAQQFYKENVEGILSLHLGNSESPVFHKLKNGIPIELTASGDFHDGEIPIAMSINKSDNTRLINSPHNIAMVHLFGDEPIKETAANFNISYKDVKKDVELAVNDFSDGSEIKLQGGFGNQKPNKRISSLIKLAQRESTYDQLLDMGYTVTELGTARNYVKRNRLSTDIPKADINSWKETARLLEDPEADRQSKIKLMNSINTSVFVNYGHLFITINALLKEVPMYASTKHSETEKVYNFLVEQGLPGGTIYKEVKNGPQKGLKRYQFILIQDKNEAINLLRAAKEDIFSDLAKPKVVVLGADDPENTNTTKLRDREKYPSALNLLHEFGFTNPSKLKKHGVALSELIIEAPVPVFNIDKSRYQYKAQDADILKKHIESELKKRGII